MMTEKRLKEVGNMCNMSSFIEARTGVKYVKNLMDSTHFTLEEALDILKVDDDDRPYIIDRLEDDND